MMKHVTGIALCVGLLAGCSGGDDRLRFDGQYFNAKLRKVERQLDVFTVSVKPASRSLVGAREAGRYEAVKHCVNNFGSSDIIWTSGPDVADAQLMIEGDTLVMAGRCPNAR